MSYRVQDQQKIDSTPDLKYFLSLTCFFKPPDVEIQWSKQMVAQNSDIVWSSEHEISAKHVVVDGLAAALSPSYFDKCGDFLPQSLSFKCFMFHIDFKDNIVNSNLNKPSGFSRQPILSSLKSGDPRSLGQPTTDRIQLHHILLLSGCRTIWCRGHGKSALISEEKKHRIVHYRLVDTTPNSLLAVVGIERSRRHMIYSVTEDLLRVFGSMSTVHAGTLGLQ